jgi:hypothetical protein
MGILRKDLWTFMITSRFFCRMEMFRTKVAKTIKRHILCLTTFFSENRVVYEITWKNMVDPSRPQMTIRPVRFVCRIPKPTNTHSEYIMPLLLYGNEVYASAPQCYVLGALPVILMQYDVKFRLNCWFLFNSLQELVQYNNVLNDIIWTGYTGFIIWKMCMNNVCLERDF